MNREELKNEFEKIGVPARMYSLFDDLNPDTIVLFHNYAKWEVFYFSERGVRYEEKVFFSEGDACEYIYNRLKRYGTNK